MAATPREVGVAATIRATREGYCPVTTLEAADGAPAPTAFVATTVKEYRPATGRVITSDRAEDGWVAETVVASTDPSAASRDAATR
jgi:hypothetical protein